MKSVMSHQFSQVPAANIPRSSFNRSHGFKTTFNGGYLIPVFVDEALPGDTFSLNMSVFARLATPIVPFMDNLRCNSFFFAVPLRLIWDNFPKFMGEQKNPGDSTDFLTPVMTAPAGTGHLIGSLSDYMGIPTGIALLQHCSFWHRAYNLCWNEWFRDQNLQTSLVVDLDDGPDASTDYVIKKRGKRHDYFTSCLPWPQKGPAVTLPLGTSAPVYGPTYDGTILKGSLYQTVAGGVPLGVGSADVNASAGAAGRTIYGTALATGATAGQQFSLGTKANYTTVPGFQPPYADLSTATAATINALRQAFQLQKLYERDARGGTRLTEIIRSHFGVISPDARLQRPEFLGGGSTNINVHPISQTSSTDATTPQGNVAAMGTMAFSGHGFSKSFTEHTVILGMVCVTADLNYQQGLNRMFSRRTRWDYYWPALSHIGEQAVLNKEIYAKADANDDIVFGYQERHAEYRYKPSVITGLFRSTAAGTLDIWHLAQKFTTLPLLNATFIEETPPIERVVAVPSQPHFLFDAYYSLKCARPMPAYSVPGLIDHF